MEILINDVNISDVQYFPNKRMKIIKHSHDKMDFIQTSKRTLIEKTIITIAEWLKYGTSDNYNIALARANAEDWQLGTRKLEKLAQSIKSRTEINHKYLYSIATDSYRFIVYLNGKQGKGFGNVYMKDDYLDEEESIFFAEMTLRYYDFLVHYNSRLNNLHEYRTRLSLLDGRQINRCENRYISHVVFSDQLTPFDVNYGLLKLVAYNNELTTERYDQSQGILFFNPLSKIEIYISTNEINPMIINGIENIICTGRNIHAMERCSNFPKVKLIDPCTKEKTNCWITDRDSHIVFCRDVKSGEIYGMSSSPGIWWYKDRIWVNRNADTELQNQYFNSMEQQDLYFKLLNYLQNN